jgi:uncharacterized protein YciI
MAGVSEPQEWFVLLHVPGPAVADGDALSGHPQFAEHLAFLRRRMADGSLVAAGPLGDAAGEGMTVLRAPSLDEARRLAEVDDLAVAGGVLGVTVRPWHVVMAPVAGG